MTNYQTATMPVSNVMSSSIVSLGYDTVAAIAGTLLGARSGQVDTCAKNIWQYAYVNHESLSVHGI